MIKLIQTHSAGGDCCAPYDVILDKQYTVGEFVNEVLTRYSNEWGYFNVSLNGDSWLTRLLRLEYRYGKLLGELTDDISQMEISKAKSYGGWSAMDYNITVK